MSGPIANTDYWREFRKLMHMINTGIPLSPELVRTEPLVCTNNLKYIISCNIIIGIAEKTQYVYTGDKIYDMTLGWHPRILVPVYSDLIHHLSPVILLLCTPCFLIINCYAGVQWHIVIE